jgi:hypothetical protein
MGIPLRQSLTVLRYILMQRLRGVERFPRNRIERLALAVQKGIGPKSKSRASGWFGSVILLTKVSAFRISHSNKEMSMKLRQDANAQLPSLSVFGRTENTC